VTNFAAKGEMVTDARRRDFSVVGGAKAEIGACHALLAWQ